MFMPEVVTLRALFEDELRDVYDAETRIVLTSPEADRSGPHRPVAHGARGSEVVGALLCQVP
jgi:hypothetical protein